MSQALLAQQISLRAPHGWQVAVVPAMPSLQRRSFWQLAPPPQQGWPMPPHIPHLPGIPCMVMQRSGAVQAVWAPPAQQPWSRPPQVPHTSAAVPGMSTHPSGLSQAVLPALAWQQGWPDLPHGWQVFPSPLPEAQR
jgi:hypothetical protein